MCVKREKTRVKFLLPEANTHFSFIPYFFHFTHFLFLFLI